MMGTDPSTWISLAALAISIIFGTLNAGHTSRTDVKEQLEDARRDAAQQARIETSLSTIQQDTGDIKSDLRGLKSDMQDITTRLAKVEQSVSSAHKRIDEIVKREGVENDQLESKSKE